MRSRVQQGLREALAASPLALRRARQLTGCTVRLATPGAVTPDTAVISPSSRGLPIPARVCAFPQRRPPSSSERLVVPPVFEPSVRDRAFLRKRAGGILLRLVAASFGAPDARSWTAFHRTDVDAMPGRSSLVTSVNTLSAAALLLWSASVLSAFQHPPAPTAPPPSPPAGGGLSVSAPRSAEDKAAIERGKAVFGISCGFCHGSDARGGSTGPNLWRSPLVLTDRQGTEIAKLIREGRPDKGMPPIALSDAQSKDVAAFLHSLPASGRDPARMRPPSIVVGDAAAGARVFARTCASCHSATGDLKGLGAKYADPRQLQHAWLMPGSQRGGPPASTFRPSVSVTTAAGVVTKGTLVRIDDFIVSLVDAEGKAHTFRRTGTTPKVELVDRLDVHRELVPTYVDRDIHDLTAYLVTLK